MKLLLKLLSYPISVIHYFIFGIGLVVFHVIQWVCFTCFGYKAHKKSVDLLNWYLLRCLNILGAKIDIDYQIKTPQNKPIIIVSNHQSMWDIPLIIWYLRKCHPKFISKRILGKGIPSISYNLRHGGSVLIDRGDSDKARAKIFEFSRYLKKYKRGGVIFPEGTRSKDGLPKPFKRSGLRILIENIPTAYVLPVTINNNWKLQRNGMFPLPLGIHLKMKVHAPLKASDFELESLINQIERTIIGDILKPTQN